jgi:hypothetical protein
LNVAIQGGSVRTTTNVALGTIFGDDHLGQLGEDNVGRSRITGWFLLDDDTGFVATHRVASSTIHSVTLLTGLTGSFETGILFATSDEHTDGTRLVPVLTTGFVRRGSGGLFSRD